METKSWKEIKDIVYGLKGTERRYIEEILGHKSSRTTEIYTHVSTKSLQNIKSPIDDL